MHEVILFYNVLDVQTRKILDLKGAIPSKTTADAKVAFKEMAEYSQKWHNGTSRTRRASVSVMPLSTYLNLGLGELAHTKLTVELADRTVKYLKGIPENMLVGIDKFVFPIDFIILDMPEDVKVPLILGRSFLSTAHAKIDFDKRVYMLSLRERMELDLEARLMGETLVLNRSLDPLYGDYIELNDLNVPLELKRDQVDDLMPTIEKCEVIEEFKARNDARMDKLEYKGNNVVGALMNIPIFVGTFSVLTDFAVLDDMDAYRDKGIGDVISGELFLREVRINARRFEGMITIYNDIATCLVNVCKAWDDWEVNHYGNVNSVIIEYLVKISKKARILELKRRYLKITVLTTNASYPLRKIRRICAYTSQKTMKETRSNTPYSVKTNTPYSSYGNKIFWKISNVLIRRIGLFPDLINRKLKNEF
ncbi:hypothetical protein Tco_0675656 [Tanacetum coccineum]